MDGGSNDYDRISNQQKFTGWNPKINTPTYTVRQILKILKESTIDAYTLGEEYCQTGDSSLVDLTKDGINKTLGIHS